MDNLKKLSIKELASEDRPREKLVLKGVSSLSNAELIAILIGSGNRNETAVELSQRILKSQLNNLNNLARLSVKDLMETKGIGEAKAISIIAALELGKRRSIQEIHERKKITSSNDVFQLYQPQLIDLPFEEFHVVYLNRSNNILKSQKFSQGGVSGTIIDSRLVLKEAIALLASSLILCHNHPSGNIKPSQSDIEITKKLKQGASLFDIQVLDHIIIGDKKYYSFADEGII